MTVLTFPSNPQSGDTYSAPNGVLYTYDGVKWIAQTTTTTSQEITNFYQDSIAPLFTNIVSDNITFTYDQDTNVLSASVTAQANTGTITFTNDTIKGSGTQDGSYLFGKMTLAPNYGIDLLDYGQFINIYPTLNNDAPHIHIAAGTGNLGTGDLMLGDDDQYVDVNHNGSIRVRTFDRVRGNVWNYWEFQKDGTLSGPAMGGVIVPAIIGMPGNGLTVYAGDQGRNEATVQFTDADGTEKSTFSVDMNSYPLYGISTQNYANLYWTVSGSVAITNIAFNENIATFTVSAPVTLAAGTDYLVEWGGTTYPDLTLQSNGGNITLRANGDTSFQGNKNIYQGNTVHRSNAGSFNIGTPTVVWSSSASYISSVKLLIQIECQETGDNTGIHTQTCEAIISSRGWLGGVGEPVMTVYGVVHTSVDNLVTFTVQRNQTTNVIEVLATPTLTAAGTIYYCVSAVEIITWD